jgi:hypothetical protein
MFSLLLVFSHTAFARIPEPDTIFVGSLVGEGGAAVVSRPGQRVVVRAVVDGLTLASADIPDSGDGRFVLRVPMDDGATPRLPGTAKSNDRIRIIVDNEAAGLSVETEETKRDGMEIPAGRGNVLSLSFSVADAVVVDDVNANGIPDEWEYRYSSPRNGFAALSLARDDSSLDNDGDGFSNREEYIVGTDPQDAESRFVCTTITHDSEALRISFSPVEAGRVYSLRRSASLAAPSKDWTTIATFRTESKADAYMWTLPRQVEDSCFYRVAVEVSE